MNFSADASGPKYFRGLQRGEEKGTISVTGVLELFGVYPTRDRCGVRAGKSCSLWSITEGAGGILVDYSLIPLVRALGDWAALDGRLQHDIVTDIRGDEDVPQVLQQGHRREGTLGHCPCQRGED